MKKTSKILAMLIVVSIVCLSFAGCGGNSTSKAYKVGICNYVDDASLNQIVDNIKATLSKAEKEKGVKIEVLYDNCNADTNVLSQIISNFTVQGVDLMIGVATPVALAMQSATEDSNIPVVFAAVSDPVSTGLVEDMNKPNANITGTSDYLDTNAIMNLMFANDSSIKKVGLLYDAGQDSSTTPIKAAKNYLEKKGIKVVEKTGTTVDEIVLAAQSLITEKVDAVFTPTDNTVMTAQLSIYEAFAKAGIPHYTGADSFALNGAFVGYGVDYANLGIKTGEMAVSLLFGAKVAETPVLTFDNGTATINTEICQKLGYNLETVKEKFAPHCIKIQEIVTAESFDDINK